MASIGYPNLKFRGVFPMAKKVIGRLRSLGKDEAGVTAIEYGLIAALIAVIIITAVSIVGTDLRNMFNTIGASI